MWKIWICITIEVIQSAIWFPCLIVPRPWYNGKYASCVQDKFYSVLNSEELATLWIIGLGFHTQLHTSFYCSGEFQTVITHALISWTIFVLSLSLFFYFVMNFPLSIYTEAKYPNHFPLSFSMQSTDQDSPDPLLAGRDHEDAHAISCQTQGQSEFRHSKHPSLSLKALFNNVFTLKNLSCMSLHAISVFDKV